MNLATLLATKHSGVQWELPAAALEKWNPQLAAASSENTITILDYIGDYWGEGVTARRISAALRSIGPDKDVEVLINSPGGDLFEGLAIYSLLKEHKGKVTIKVLSLAASAASVIAMAGDEILISRAGFFMIHNTWVMAMGDRNQMRNVAEYLEPFDEAMADLYSETTGLSASALMKMMDAETWMSGKSAVDKGFAHGFLNEDEITEDNKNNNNLAAKKLDLILAKAGISRGERRKLVAEIKGSDTPGAVGADTPSAVELPRMSFNYKLEV